MVKLTEAIFLPLKQSSCLIYFAGCNTEEVNFFKKKRKDKVQKLSIEDCENIEWNKEVTKIK